MKMDVDVVGTDRDNDDADGGTSSQDRPGCDDDLEKMTTGCIRLKKLVHCYSAAGNLDNRMFVATCDNDLGTSLAVETVHFHH